MTEGWADPDDAPPLTKAWFERAELRNGETVCDDPGPEIPWLLFVVLVLLVIWGVSHG